MPRPFLTAEWRNLFLATYGVPPALLRQRLPPGLELDTRDGLAFVSVVAFEFLDTRVLGVPWPGYRDFAEAKLRCAVASPRPSTSARRRPWPRSPRGQGGALASTCRSAHGAGRSG